MKTKNEVLIELWLLISDDKLAITFQTMSNYRYMLKSRIAEMLDNEPTDTHIKQS